MRIRMKCGVDIPKKRELADKHDGNGLKSTELSSSRDPPAVYQRSRIHLKPIATGGVGISGTTFF